MSAAAARIAGRFFRYTRCPYDERVLHLRAGGLMGR